ncbi:MAG: TetR/AcrR family transcriptional regulator [Solirubrobacteraceae bacterium]
MTFPADGPRWQRLEHDERRGQILDVARRLFSERTFTSVSMAEIARESGVARGLLNHYFGSKRDLYLEVIRQLMRMPTMPIPAPGPDHDVKHVIAEGADRWLTLLERNRGAWLAAAGAQGLGRDPEVEAILEAARERAIDRLIDALPQEVQRTAELRALLRAYSALAEATSLEWLERERLTREQARTLVVESFLALIGDVLPALQAPTSRGA